jgi:hypothetical protein
VPNTENRSRFSKKSSGSNSIFFFFTSVGRGKNLLRPIHFGFRPFLARSTSTCVPPAFHLRPTAHPRPPARRRSSHRAAHLCLLAGRPTLLVLTCLPAARRHLSSPARRPPDAGRRLPDDARPRPLPVHPTPLVLTHPAIAQCARRLLVLPRLSAGVRELDLLLGTVNPVGEELDLLLGTVDPREVELDSLPVDERNHR